ncbi:hypothetical protein DPMN_085311 [Dreissena polymorpha]|uniref:Uncharacterized protein n=1 Tax=Dreissena polymorpha TaxID=45954 RepID=A0A9D3YET2_DREPO|nr:hypothetical protein DPMN_085311 [Dreissena polymorpha]
MSEIELGTHQESRVKPYSTVFHVPQSTTKVVVILWICCGQTITLYVVPIIAEYAAVQDLLCYVQWSNIQYTSKQAQLPECDSLPSKWDSDCTEAKMFDRDESH